MSELTAEGRQIANDLSIRHNFSLDAIAHMMSAVQAGNGSMAQFNHHEFAGNGQWMQGGMTMIGDMFNNSLKGRVDMLCQDIANILATQPNAIARGGSFQSQSQGGPTQSRTSHQMQATGQGLGNSSPFFEPDPDQNWWPQDLGPPAAVGAQNNVAYAYFPQCRRLAVRTGDQVWVYDTLQHQIGGFSQQQAFDGSISFTSQFGNVALGTLPVVMRNGVPQSPPATPPSTEHEPEASSSKPTLEDPLSSHRDILDAIERLAEMNERGILTDDEFLVKKEELLSRL